MPWSGIASAGIGALGSLIGGGINAFNAREQMAQQKEFAQNGIRWKVADAKAAGIHPLAALGAQTFSYNPVAVGDYGISEALGRFGQGIDRAQHAKALAEERALDNGLKKAQIANINAQTDAVAAQAAASKAALAQTALPPPMPKVNNAKEASSYSADSSPLMSLSRVGNLLVEHLDPDLADAITEDMVKNLAVIISAEGQSGRTKREAYFKLSPSEQAAVLRGDADLFRTPDVGWRFLYKPHMRPKYFEKNRSVSGRLIFTNK